MKKRTQPREPREFVLRLENDKMPHIRIRLIHDSLTFSDFLRIMIDGYLENDVDIMKYLTKAKKLYKIHSIKKRKESLDLIVKGQELEKDFALTEEEINNIYDILEDDCLFEKD